MAEAFSYKNLSPWIIAENSTIDQLGQNGRILVADQVEKWISATLTHVNPIGSSDEMYLRKCAELALVNGDERAEERAQEKIALFFVKMVGDIPGLRMTLKQALRGKIFTDVWFSRNMLEEVRVYRKRLESGLATGRPDLSGF